MHLSAPVLLAFKGVNNGGYLLRGWFVCAYPVVYYIIHMIQAVLSFINNPAQVHCPNKQSCTYCTGVQ